MNNKLYVALRKRIKIKRYLNKLERSIRLLPRPATHPEKKFIIFAQGRSGSTLLVSLMNCHKEIFCDGEILNRLDYGKIYNPLKYINMSTKLSGINRKKVYGFKVKIYQLVEDQKYKDYQNILERLHAEGWYFIHLRRSNIVKQSLSNQIYRAQGFSNTTKAEQIKKIKIKVVLKHLIKNIERRIKYNELEDEILKDIPHLSINYEKDLLDSESHQQTADKIFHYLGLESCNVETKYLKISSPKIQDNISNYDELYEFLKSKGYEHFL